MDREPDSWDVLLDRIRSQESAIVSGLRMAGAIIFGMFGGLALSWGILAAWRLM